MRKQFFGSLESLRGIAALLLFFYHEKYWYAPLNNSNFINNCYLTLDFFFILSGFVLFYSYGTKKISNKKDLLRFVFLRFGRIYPVHFMFLLLFSGIEIVKHIALIKYGLAANPADKNTLGAFFEELFLVQALGLSDHAMTFNNPSWSISTEFYTYLIFGFSILIFKKYYFTLWSASIVSVSLLLLIFWHKEIGDFIFILRCLAGFFVGCLTCILYQNITIEKLPNYCSTASIVTVIAFLYFKVPSSEGIVWMSKWDSAIFPLSCVLILTTILSPQSFLNLLLNMKTLRWLGKISYSFYMAHFATIWASRLALKVVFQKPIENIQLTIQWALIIYPLTLIFTILVAWISFKYIEEPFRKWSKKTTVFSSENRNLLLENI